MEYATFMWVKARFDAAEKRVEALDGRVHELAVAVLSLVATLQSQGAAQMESVTRVETALADLKVREDALLARDSANAAAAAQTTSDLAVAQAKVQAITEQLTGVSADRDALKLQLDDLNSHLATMATNAEAARDALPPVPVAVDPNAGASAPSGSASTGSPAPSDSGASTPSASDSTTPASSATPADGSGAAPAASPTPAASDAGTASAPAATATPPDPAQVGSADPTGAAPTGQSAGDTSAVGSPTVVNENVSDGAVIKDPAA